jgi:predicted nucleotidyltransferase component of viral defense system
MGLSPEKILTALQWDFLSSFFEGGPPFVLTRGTALSAFYLQHRYSEDLDLFTLDGDAFDRVPLYVADTAARLTASVASLQVAPLFRRYKISRGEKSVIVDFFKELAPQFSEQKNDFDGIWVDTLPDIATNKVCTLLGRAEIKDYIDVYFLARAGYALEDYIQAAQRKDAGVSKATLAFVLSQVKLSKVPDFMIAPVDVAAVQEYFQSLAAKLAVESFPR